MATQIIKGDDLMLFDAQGKSYAYATAHTLTITADTSDTSSKDHGVWKGNEVSKISWEITSENLFTEDAYDTLFDSMINRTAITCAFGLKKDGDADKTVADGDYTNWTPDYEGATPASAKAKKVYTGTAYITSLTANANTGENATFSITLTGTGSIKKAENTFVVDANWNKAQS